MRGLHVGVLLRDHSKNHGAFTRNAFQSLPLLFLITLSQGFNLTGVVSAQISSRETSSAEFPYVAPSRHRQIDRGFVLASPIMEYTREQQQKRRRLTSACGPGFVNRVGTELCAQCRAGWFNNDTEPSDVIASCTRCMPGYFNEQVQQSTCNKCEIGKASNTSARNSMCDECIPGKYADLLGLRECKLCPIGMVQRANGSSACIKCGAGYYSDAKGAATCKSCSPGWMQNKTGAEKCRPCTPGKYQSESSESICKDCATGQYASNKGHALCNDCQKGRFANETGEHTCKVCASGQYQVCRWVFSPFLLFLVLLLMFSQ